MRSHNFHSMNFPQIWYKDSFRVSDVNFNKKKWESPSPFSYHGNQNIMVYIAQHFRFCLIKIGTFRSHHLSAIFGIKMHKSCFQYNHLKQKFRKNYPIIFFLSFFLFWQNLDLTNRNSKNSGYRPNFLVIQQLSDHAYAQQWCAQMHARIILINFHCFMWGHDQFFWPRWFVGN